MSENYYPLLKMHNIQEEHHAKVGYAVREVLWLDKWNRVKALSMMSLGAMIGIVGFVIAAIGGYWNISSENANHANVAGHYYASGEAYYPLTVSEMVSDPRSSAGKAFLAFELAAAILILGSWYPYYLTNCYIGQRHKVLGNCSWATFRQFIPMTGLFLVALVSVTPTTRMQPSDIVTNQIHILAATALFGGYIFCEMVCLFVMEEYVEVMKGRCLRICVIAVCAIGAVTTIVLQFTYPYMPTSVLPCQDEYEEYTIQNLTQFVQNMDPDYNTGKHFTARQYIQSVALATKLSKADPVTVLTNTASGVCLHLKVITFWSEVVAGLCGFISHLVIWYYAPERVLHLGDTNSFGSGGESSPEED
jgi:hypothetical protein